jgi:Ni,Fe-hydrogenase III component G
MTTRKHTVTFTTQEIVAALLDKFPGEFSDEEMEGEPQIYAHIDGTYEIRYESKVPQ